MSRRASKNSTSTSTSEPWEGIQPYLRNLYARGLNVSDVPASYAYRFGPVSNAARQTAWRQTASPTPLERASRGEAQSTVEGDYLLGGPAFNAAYQAASNRIIPQVSSMFSGGGRLNSGLAQQAMTGALSDAFAGLYNQERARQTSMAAQYPAFQSAQLQRLGVPLQLGQQADELARLRALEPQQRLGWYGNLLGVSNTGPGTTTVSSPVASSTLGNMLGGAMLGQSLYSGMMGSSSPLWGGGSSGFSSGIGLGAGTGYSSAFPFEFSGGY